MKHKMAVSIGIILLAVIGMLVFIFIYYTTQFSLSLKGSDEMTVGLYSVYEDPGIEAKKGGKDISGKVKVTGKVDTEKPGEYVLQYRMGTLTAERTVIVSNEMNPRLMLTDGEWAAEMLLGEEFEEPGYEAYDENGKDISDRVIVSDLDFNKAGRHTIDYTVSDDAGNTTRISRIVKIAPNTDYKSPGLPICMYHYVYDEDDPPDDLKKRYGNYISQQDLSEELAWLNEEGYYFPSWEEVRAYIDGELLLPEKSIVLCFDDGADSFLTYGIPVLEKYKVPATCFMITSYDGENKIASHQSEYVDYESHSHDMHKGGGKIGHGGIFTALSKEKGLADLNASIKICGSSNAFAYPFGDYNNSSRDMVEEAGFLCAVTTEYGKAYPGDDPMLLPRVRMSEGQSLERFIGMVAPKTQQKQKR